MFGAFGLLAHALQPPSQAWRVLRLRAKLQARRKVDQVRLELTMGVVEVSFDDSVLDGSVHPFDLVVDPGVVRLCEPMFDSMKVAEPVEGMAAEACGWPLTVLG